MMIAPDTSRVQLFLMRAKFALKTKQERRLWHTDVEGDEMRSRGQASNRKIGIEYRFDPLILFPHRGRKKNRRKTR